MENSVHAIKMVFGVIVFSLALGIALMLFSQAKSTSQAILYLKEYEMSNNSNQEQENSNEYRVVGLETVIPTIFDYYKSKSIIYLKKGKYDKNNDEIVDISNIKLYKSEQTKDNIYCFDIEDEIKRMESWTKNDIDTKAFLRSTLCSSELNEIFNMQPKFIERIGKQYKENGQERTVIEYILID